MTCEICCHAPVWRHTKPPGNPGKAFSENQFTNSFAKQTLTRKGQASQAENLRVWTVPPHHHHHKRALAPSPEASLLPWTASHCSEKEKGKERRWSRPRRLAPLGEHRVSSYLDLGRRKAGLFTREFSLCW